MTNYNYDYESEPARRPSFLTWLCILTFIGSGWAIVSSVYTFTSADKYANIFAKESVSKKDTLKIDSPAVAHKEGNAFSEKIKHSFAKILQKDNMRNLAIGNLIAALFTLAGAILMWNLKRSGFYLYIVGVAIALWVPFYLFGNDLIAVGATSFNNFFGLIFIALYDLNLKSLRGKEQNNIV
ncbi:MAG: hypothetical protein ABI366_06025 [Ginsengibacter sp.]